MFLHSARWCSRSTCIGVLIFAGLIAFDTQRLKMTYYQLGGDQAAMSVATNYGALSLYLDFINLFRFLLRDGRRSPLGGRLEHQRQEPRRAIRRGFSWAAFSPPASAGPRSNIFSTWLSSWPRLSTTPPWPTTAQAPWRRARSGCFSIR